MEACGQKEGTIAVNEGDGQQMETTQKLSALTTANHRLVRCTKNFTVPCEGR